MGRIWQTFGHDAYAMCTELLEAAHAAALVPHAGTVALKPNLVLADVAEHGAVTHPGVVGACIDYFHAHGIFDLSVIESSWIGDDTMRAARASGLADLCREREVPLFDLKRDEVVEVDSPIGTLGVCRRALEAELLVDLPVLKGHCQTRMTCCLKNLKGCIPDREKRRYHTLGLTRPIAALASVLRPGLCVVDSICGDLCFEEGGTPVETGRMFLGTDCVQTDAYAASLMGLELSDVAYIGLAQRFGAGSVTWTSKDIRDLKDPAKAGDYPTPSGRVASLTRRVHDEQACSACFASLVRALYLTGRTDRDVYIGQGWQGTKIKGLGVGRCCAGATQTVMGCPPTPAAIARALQEA